MHLSALLQFAVSTDCEVSICFHGIMLHGLKYLPNMHYAGITLQPIMLACLTQA